MLASTTLNLGSLGAHRGSIAPSPSLKPPFPVPPPPNWKSSSSFTGSSSSIINTTTFKLANHPVRTAVAAVDSSDPIDKEEEASPGRKQQYHFVVANAKFMLDEEEHFKELMGERLRLFGERSKEQDFWLVIEPKFLDKFPNITKRLKRPAVALVSTNAPWITFMKLRLDRVLQESFEADSVEEALASDPVELSFEKPEKWTAPYSKYEFGWWEPFLPPKESSKVV